MTLLRVSFYLAALRSTECKFIQIRVMSNLIRVIVSCPSREEGLKISEMLVREKVAACAQLSGPVESIYHWKDKIHQGQEWRLEIKTRIGLYDTLEEKVKELHSYDVPEIIIAPIRGGNEDYLKWIVSTTTKSSSTQSE